MRGFNKHILRLLLYIPYSIYFNFRVLPYHQAIRLPILFAMRPNFLAKVRKNSVVINGEVKCGMIRLGRTYTPIYPRQFFKWENRGRIVFNGSCQLSSNSFICCDDNAEIVFGAQNAFNVNNVIIAYKRIEFKDYVRSSWGCTFIDTDFHPLLDMISHEQCKMHLPITIGTGCWIGHNCIISKGVRLADHSTVSSGSVVKGVFKEPYCIIGGNLARVLDKGYIRDDMHERFVEQPLQE